MQEYFNKILDSISKSNACASATVVAVVGSSPRKVGARMVVFSDGSTWGTIGGGALEKVVIDDARDALRHHRSILKEYPLDKRSGMQVCGGSVSIFIETLEPQKTLVIFGGGHIGLALSVVAKLLHFNVVIVDNRKAFANKERFPHADKVLCCDYAKAFKTIAADHRTFIVIVTHGHAFDAVCLEGALKAEPAYIGMIGSEQKIKHVFNALLKKGFMRSQLRKVHTPVGLEIGAETPEEIAVSIAAQLVQVLREGSLRQEVLCR